MKRRKTFWSNLTGFVTVVWQKAFPTTLTMPNRIVCGLNSGTLTGCSGNQWTGESGKSSGRRNRETRKSSDVPRSTAMAAANPASHSALASTAPNAGSG